MNESYRHDGGHPYAQDPYQQSAPAYPGHPDTTAPTPAYAPYPTQSPDPTYSPDPAYAPGEVPPATTGRRRGRAPFALLAAVALVAGAAGGGIAYTAHQLTDTTASASSASGVSGTPVSEGSKGTVAGVAKAVSPSIVDVRAAVEGGRSGGSGVIVSGDGEIVTNNHVVSGASQIKVETSDGKSYDAKLVGADPAKDLALIKLSDASGLKAASLGDSDALRVGDGVVAIGSPEGLSGTVTSGIISALDREVTVPVEDHDGGQGTPWDGGGDGGWPFEFGGKEFNGDTGSETTTYQAIQTDASLNPGNSGGALLNMSGQLIGINSAMYSPPSSGSVSSSPAGSVGLGFAIPVNTVKSDLAQLRSGGTGG